LTDNKTDSITVSQVQIQHVTGYTTSPVLCCDLYK